MEDDIFEGSIAVTIGEGNKLWVDSVVRKFAFLEEGVYLGSHAGDVQRQTIGEVVTGARTTRKATCATRGVLPETPERMDVETMTYSIYGKLIVPFAYTRRGAVETRNRVSQKVLFISSVDDKQGPVTKNEAVGAIKMVVVSARKFAQVGLAEHLTTITFVVTMTNVSR